MDFKKNYQQLNAAQKQAVDTVDGPVLVIAGPGTGKTQLLGMRVANILNKTDTLPQNVLCLTFTESGAANMRERLGRFIGQEAYNVTISTYHAFGGDLIRRFPEYFGDVYLESPVDDLTKYQILEAIVGELGYDNPLKQTRWHLHDLISTISEVKRALLTSRDLERIAAENSEFITYASQRVALALDGFTRMPGKYDKAAPVFEKILYELRPLIPEEPVSAQFGSLAAVAVRDLATALQEAFEANSSKPLTAWKNEWLAKDADNRFIMDGEPKNRRIAALADVFASYQAALEERRLYDFDDMIIRSIQALERHDDLRFTLQEQYLYLLLDEFQDTNAAQLKLIELLTNNPASEGRPNVMAVGDDDQAIYAFQGAQYSNMLDFYHMYQGVKVINLTENYRSHRDVLHTAEQIAAQIDARLHHHFEGSSKVLSAENRALTEANLDRHEFLSEVAEYNWIATQVAALIKKGTSPSEIAVLAPKHKQLEPLVAYLNAQNIPVRYEKRENILETSVVRQLLTMAKLVLALGRGDTKTADSLWPEVLSYDFWQLPLAYIWQFSWKVRDAGREQGWSQHLLDDAHLREPAQLLIALSMKAASESLETMLDYLIGSQELDVHAIDGSVLQSPLRSFYTSQRIRSTHPEQLYETLSHLTVLRARLRDYQQSTDSVLMLQDLVEFVQMYEAAGQGIINTSPYAQAAEAVQLMTVFKAKGLEFQHVFLPHALNDVWGDTSRARSNRISLPANLAPIRPAGTSPNERLRILFVALTRAKTGLHITSHTTKYSGKATKRLKYLNEQEQPEGGHRALSLPEHAQTVHRSDQAGAPALETLEQHWHARHLAGINQVQLRDLLDERLKKYQLSPTHLGDFIDLEHCGPEEFFLRTILCFPGATTPELAFGSATHQTLEWLQHQYDQQGTLPAQPAIDEHFSDRIARYRLADNETKRLIQRGHTALRRYLAVRSDIFTRKAQVEKSFRFEGVFVGEAHLAGAIDRMEIDEKTKTITVVDYKTGRSTARWAKTLKLHKYAQQLYCYKILIEHSRTYKNYTVNAGRIEFIEPDESGAIHALDLTFKPEEVEHTQQLLQAVWQRICNLNMPDISGYEVGIASVLQFEQDIIDSSQ